MRHALTREAALRLGLLPPRRKPPATSFAIARSEDVMSTEVKKATETLKDTVDKIGTRAKRLADKAQASATNAEKVCDAAEGYVDDLDKAMGELQAVLGGQTNAPNDELELPKKKSGFSL